ncbi:hypothetical protein [Streptantibioticus silvisoli]|uniref:Cytochrome P450 n=1 Tax=Streptantibioticus silvisoli TaxID=2705255 RepID=A0ABT6VRQ6_9ACTN|nr:hypothetical protein [Streptantibioticus silvisoli]MDI5961152.1 hypothetical protein [Streptantibioticus silvisoli]
MPRSEPRESGPGGPVDAQLPPGLARPPLGPVVPVALSEDGRAWGWLVTGVPEAGRVLGGEAFTPDPAQWSGGEDLARRLLPQTAAWSSTLAVAEDVRRRLGAPAAAALRALDERDTRGHVEHVADELIDWFAPPPHAGAAARPGRAEVRKDFARQLPRLVMMRLLGMDDRYAAGMSQCVDELRDGGPYATSASARLDAKLRQLVAEKSAALGPDLLSRLIARGPGLTADEVAHQARLLLVADLERCTAAITRATAGLLLSPPGYPIRETAADALRHGSAGRPRCWFARSDIRLGDARVRCGDLVLLALPQRGPGALRHRGPRDLVGQLTRVITTGVRTAPAGGPRGPAGPARTHRLAELITVTAVRRLFHRLSAVELDVPASELVTGPAGPTELPIRFTRAAPEPVTPPRHR